MSDQAKSTQETTLAWFKLAELIARKEREKALNVYRLLSHSLEDKAYALQIEGDILRSFNAHDATEKYQQAAFLYKQEQRLVNAVGIYEHLLNKDKLNLEFLIILVDLYAKLDWQEKCALHFETLSKQLAHYKEQQEQSYKLIKQVLNNHQSKSWFVTLVATYQSTVAEEIKEKIFTRSYEK